MRKRNGVKQLNMEASHRKAMLRNMVTSFFDYESVKSTKARIKVLQPMAEKIISRAKRVNELNNEGEEALHHKRELLKVIRSRTIVSKLCEDVGARYSERKGGYTRILRLINRKGDNSEMAMLELVDKKEPILIKEQRTELLQRRLTKKQREKVQAKAKIKADIKASESKGKAKKKKKKDEE